MGAIHRRLAAAPTLEPHTEPCDGLDKGLCPGLTQLTPAESKHLSRGSGSGRQGATCTSAPSMLLMDAVVCGWKAA